MPDPTRDERLGLLAWALKDFRRFCGLLQIVPFEGPRCRLQLMPMQRAFCDARTGRDIVLKPRRVGFTTLEQARDIWHMLTRPGASVVVTCQSMTGDAPKKDLAKAFRLMFDSLRQLGLALDLRSETATEWVLADRDASLRIMEAGASHAAAVKKGRAGAITRLHMTETAFYEYAADTLNAMLECVPDKEHGSEIVNESTANGASGEFHRQYWSAVEGRSGYRAHFFPWWIDPRRRLALAPGETIAPDTEREHTAIRAGVSAEQLNWYRQKVLEKGQDACDQEYPSDDQSCWLPAGRVFFDRSVTDRIRNAVRPACKTDLGGALMLFELPEPGHTYLVSGDPSEGMGGDPGAAVVLDRETGRHVATLHGQFPTWQFADLLARTGAIFFFAPIVVERNNHGGAVLQALEQSHHYPRIYRAPDGKLGWNNTSLSRSTALDALEAAHRTGAWSPPDIRVVGEIGTFIVNKAGRPEASSGAHDDLILASAIAWDVLSKPMGGRHEVHDHDENP